MEEAEKLGFSRAFVVRLDEPRIMKAPTPHPAQSSDTVWYAGAGLA